MVVVLLRPADQQGAVAVEPGVAGLDDPAACLPAGHAGLQLDLFAAAADVRACSRARREQPRGRWRSRSRGRDTTVVAAASSASVAGRGSSRASRLRALSRGGWHRHAPARSGPLAASHEKRTFRPLFARSVGIRPGLCATQRCLPHRAVGRQPGPVDPDHACRTRPAPAARSRGTRRPATHSWKRRCAAHDEQIPVALTARSTASPSAAPEGSRPSRPGQASAADDTQADATAAPATTAAIRAHNQSGIRHPSSLDDQTQNRLLVR